MRASSMLLTVFLVGVIGEAGWGQAVKVVTDANASPRVQFGAERLRQALSEAGIKTTPMDRPIVISSSRANGDKPEGFTIQTTADATTHVMGNDDSGALYGCLELARRIRETKEFPMIAQFADAPAMKLRGPCIGM